VETDPSDARGLAGSDACGRRFHRFPENGSDKLRGAGQSPASGHLPRFQEHHQLPYYNTPIAYRHRPFLGNLLDGQKHGLLHGVVGRVVRLGLGELAQHPVEPLHRVGGIDQSPDFLGVLEVGGQFRPVLLPRPDDLRVLLRTSWGTTSRSLAFAAVSSME